MVALSGGVGEGKGRVAEKRGVDSGRVTGRPGGGPQAPSRMTHADTSRLSRRDCMRTCYLKARRLGIGDGV
jgi:hypothetical protein